MIYDVYVQKLVESILGNYNNKIDNYVFIKHYNVLGLSEQDVRNMIDDDNVRLMYHEYKYNEMQNPYEPFLEWIRQAYNDEFSSSMSVEEFIDNCNVYYVQKSLFISYITSGKCERIDEVLAVEVKYEKMRFIKSLINILEYIASQKRILIVLYKLHLANYSTMDFLLKLMKAKAISGIGILATYNEAFQINNYIEEVWENLKEYIENNNLLYDWATLDKQKEETSEDVFIPKSSAAKEYVIKLNNMIHGFAFEQAEYYLNIICQKIELENLHVSTNEKLKIYNMYVMLNIYRGSYNAALLMCENYKELFEENDEYAAFEYYYMLGVTFIFMNQIGSANGTVLECKRIAESIDEDFYRFRAKYLEHMVRYYAWTDMYAFTLTYEADPDFLEECEKYNYKNALAHLYVYGVSKDKNQIELVPEVFEALYVPKDMQKGMDLIDELGNDSLKINAYMNTVDFYRGLNNFKFIEKIYKNCIEILKKNDEKIELADLYNGIGYNCSIVEKYSQANDYYNEALKIFYEEQIPERMGETIYNIAFNCMQAGEYARGLEFTNLAIDLIEELGYQGYRMCKNSKLFGLAALCNYYLEADYNCYMYLNKIERIIHHIIEKTDEKNINYELWADDLFLYYFVSGVMAKKNEDYDKALELYNKATEMIKLSDPFKSFSYPTLTIELARLYKITNEPHKANMVLNECIDYCNKNGYYEKQKKLIAEQQNRRFLENHKINDLQFKELTVEQIKECTSDYAIEQKLKSRLNDINFLSRWQDRLDKDDSNIDVMIPTSLKTIQNNFSFDRVIYLKMEDKGLNMIYDSSETTLSKEDINKIENYFVNNRSAFVVSRIEKYFMEYEKIISIFGINDVVTFVGVPIMDNENIDSILIGMVFMHRQFYANRKLLDENNLVIIKYVFGQFVDAAERLRSHSEIKKMNQKLRKIASTDLLTGLLNRQGFMNVIKSCKKERGTVKNSINTILYIDLDNFKYYNDTVGHEMGDLVLVLFAKILNKCVEDQGYVVRYGGDEFILMLFGYDKDYGIEVASKIYKEIESGFISDIEEKLGRKIEIDEDKMISCCIGIAEFSDYEEETIEKALNQADEALYYVKKTVKHNYKVWEEGLKL